MQSWGWFGCREDVGVLSGDHRPLCPAVIISRQQRRVQLMRIKQREDRKEKKKKRRPHHPPPHQHKAHPPEPAYRRKPNPVRRFDGDVLSPVSPTPRVEISPGLRGPSFSLWVGWGMERGEVPGCQLASKLLKGQGRGIPGTGQLRRG